jgi:hypothetical protein
MKIRSYTFKAIATSVIYWGIDSSIHCFLYSEGNFEFIPSDANELWMRTVIVVLLVLFGMYADKHTKEMLKKEKEKRIVFNATISSTQHILNNLLNQMQFFKLKAEESNSFDDETNELYEKTIREGKELVFKLSTVEDLTEENIKASVYPKHEEKILH